MKKIILSFCMIASLAYSCGGEKKDDALLIEAVDSEGFSEASMSFGEGSASTGEEYYNGLLAAVIEVDIKLREVSRLDDIDASEEAIVTVIDEMILKIENGRKSINLYRDKDWPLRAEFHDLTEEWFSAVEGLGNDYLYDLAEQMSRIDDTWTDEEFEFYDAYSEAHDAYLEVDQRWIDFQHVYDEANNFDVGEKLDIDAIVEEEVIEEVL